MIDFTSALYLGLRHPSSALGAWPALTQGRPAARGEPAGAAGVAAELARLQGCENATLLPSTVHLFRDLFRLLAEERVVILCDAAMYPIARWGVESAAAAGVPTHSFPHHDAAALARLARRVARAKRRPVVVTDGYCPGCGRAAPIAVYAEIARRGGGYLVLDDTQALGILGDAPHRTNPYGNGGGGSLRWHGVSGPHIIVGSSLAKGFGAPLAVLAGSAQLVDRFRAHSETRVHCSPPSVAVIHAARHALVVNRRDGAALRRRLGEMVARLWRWIAAAGGDGSAVMSFPVLSCSFRNGIDVTAVQRHLLQSGVRALLTRACNGTAARLSFIVTALHDLMQIDLAGRALVCAAGTGNCYPDSMAEAI